MEDHKMAKKKARKKVGKKKAGRKKSMGKEPLIVASKIKAYIKAKGLMTASDSLEAINVKVRTLIDEAAERTRSNRRSTVKPQDL